DHLSAFAYPQEDPPRMANMPLESRSDSAPHLYQQPQCVCMHVASTARTDTRVMQEAKALVNSGHSVTIVDIEHDSARPRREQLDGVTLNHVMLPNRLSRHYSYGRTRTLKWATFKAWRMFLGTLKVVRTPASIYHAHDITALPGCYLAARLRRRPLILDAH